MKQLEGTLTLKTSTSSRQNCRLLLLHRNSCPSDFFASSVAILWALPQRVCLHLQPPIRQPSHPQTGESPPPGPRDLGGPLKNNNCHTDARLLGWPGMEAGPSCDTTAVE